TESYQTYTRPLHDALPIFINPARGPVVDEQALVEALRKKIIAGAALDVYEEEPKLAPGLAELDNVVLLPHIGSATIETRTKMARSEEHTSELQSREKLVCR